MWPYLKTAFVFADVIKLRISGWIHPGFGVGPKSDDKCPHERKKRETREARQKRRSGKVRAEMKWCCHKPWNSKDYHQPPESGERHRKDLLQSLQNGPNLSTPWFHVSKRKYNSQQKGRCCLLTLDFFSYYHLKLDVKFSSISGNKFGQLSKRT